MAGRLADTVAVVTGASRGIGKGIALGLGEAGATVYVTGRTTHEGDNPLPGAIAATAEAVTRTGGRGIAVRCDHARDAEVAALFDRVQDEQGRLDLLVNNATSFPYLGPPKEIPFWELPLTLWDQLHTVGLRSHYAASFFAAPLMIARRRGLIVNIASAGAVEYVYNVAYGAAKAGIVKMAADMAHELLPHNVAVVSVWPGLTRTETVLAQPEIYGHLAATSPQFNGRAVAALAADPNIMAKTGQTLLVPALAREYGFTDVDGTLPPMPSYAAR
jgi:dehydrogenase/reductase SDR family protein 1